MSTSHDSKAMAPMPDDGQPLPIDSEVAGTMAGLAEDAEALYVAPSWKLVWWRFRKHRLALVSGLVIIIITIVALFPGFFSTQG